MNGVYGLHEDACEPGILPVLSRAIPWHQGHGDHRNITRGRDLTDRRDECEAVDLRHLESPSQTQPWRSLPLPAPPLLRGE